MTNELFERELQNTSINDVSLADYIKENYVPIPDNATNGDIVQMIFPYYSYERNDYVQSTEDYIVDCMECMEHDLYFGYDWWNTPYQKGE